MILRPDRRNRMPAGSRQSPLGRELRRAAVLILAVFCASSARAESTAKVPNVIENRTYGFKISNPEGWQAVKNKVENMVMLRSPKDGEDDVFRENVSVSVEDFSSKPGMGPGRYKADSLSTLKESVENFLLRGDDQIALDEIPAEQLIFSGTQNGRSIRWKTIFAFKGKRAYVLTYTAEEKNYFRHLEAADKILYSFRFS